MSKLSFSDGVTFDTSGPLRIVSKFDGLYVVGNGMLAAVDSIQEGQALIAQMTARRMKDKVKVSAHE